MGKVGTFKSSGYSVILDTEEYSGFTFCTKYVEGEGEVISVHAGGAEGRVIQRGPVDSFPIDQVMAQIDAGTFSGATRERASV